MNDVVPSWPTLPLSEVGLLHCGQSPSTKDVNPNGNGTRYITGPEQWDGHTIHETKWTTNPKRIVPDGCIFITVKGSGVGKIFPGISGAIGRDIYAFEPSDAHSAKYVEYALKFTVQDILRNAVGDIPGISKRHILDHEIMMPPLTEQESIVAEIDKQFSHLDEAVANLKRVKANLKRYKAAVLKAAVEGKLTEEWRKAHLPAPTSRPGKFYTYAILCEDDSIYIGHTEDIARRWDEHRAGKGAEWTKEHRPVKIAHYEAFDSRKEAADREKWLKTGYGRKWIKRELAAGRTRQAGDVEPASKLLDRILAERRAKWEEAELAKMEANGKAPKNDKWKAKYREPTAADTSNLPELPEGWVWAITAQVGQIQLGRQRSPKNRSKDNPVKYIRAANITERGLDLEDVLDMEFSLDEQERYRLRRGDLVLSEASGSPDQVGKPAVWADELPLCCFQNTVIRLRPVIGMSPYLLVCFQSYYVNGVFSRAAGGVGINHLSANKFSQVRVALPPLAEQLLIVTEVDRHLSLIRETESQVNTNLKRADRLRQSILRHAFIGDLAFTMTDAAPVSAAAL